MAVAMITDHRGEVRVETGVGTILKIEPKGDRNVKVTIRAEHLREDLSCWVDRQGPTWSRVEWAIAHPDHRLWYRIDVHRGRGVAVDVPYAQLANRQKVRDLVHLCRPEDAPAEITAGAAPAAASSQVAKSEPAKPAPAAAAPAAASPSQDEHPDDVRLRARTKALEQLGTALRSGQPAEVIKFLIEMAEDLGASKADIDRVADAARPKQPAEQATGQPAADLPRQALNGARDPDSIRERRPNPPIEESPAAAADPAAPLMSRTSGLTRRPQPIATDARPWEPTNSDGRLNLGSYAAGAVLEFVNLAGRLLVLRARQRAEEDPNYELRAPTRRQIYGLASQLILCADTVQVRMREGGRVDRMSASHKVARQVVREGLDAFPVPWGASAEDREAWRNLIIEHGVALTSVMLDILDNRSEPTEGPQAAPDRPEGQPPAQTG